ncbi:MAG: nucleotidyltransferase family protein [Pseudomonadota bacterium]
MKPEAAMILSAGMGTRMRPLTDHCPKPLLQVGGESMLDRSLNHVIDAGISRAIVNIHYLGGMIRHHLAGRTRPEIVISDETELLLDTGGGIVKALPHLGRCFVTINSDAVWHGPNPLLPLLASWDGIEADALMLLVPKDRAIGYTRAGDFFLDAGRPVRRGAAATAPFVFTGAQVFRADAFSDAPPGPFSTNIIWDQLIANGRLFAVVYEGDWVDVGTPKGLSLANELVAEGA